MRNKRMRTFHILAILIPELWMKNAFLVVSRYNVFYVLVNSQFYEYTLAFRISQLISKEDLFS